VIARFLLLIAIAWASIASAQPLSSLASSSLSLTPPHQWEIPALGYGKNVWSILRFTNNSDSPDRLQVDVYCGQGDRMALGPTFTVEPRKTLDIRIEAPTTVPVLCWARVNSPLGPPEVQLQGFVESLKGNQLEDFDRKPIAPTANGAWALLGSTVSGQQLYVLNASETPTTLTFCAANKPDPKACDKKGSNAVRRVANARQAVLVEVKTFKQKYLMTESSQPGRAIIEVFNDEPGHRRVYTTESAISFDAPEN
jgi:hypothetical protein